MGHLLTNNPADTFWHCCCLLNFFLIFENYIQRIYFSSCSKYTERMLRTISRLRAKIVPQKYQLLPRLLPIWELIHLHKTTPGELQTEIDDYLYLKMLCLQKEAEWISFWMFYAEKHTSFVLLVPNLLCISASSAPVVRLLSISGKMCGDISDHIGDM